MYFTYERFNEACDRNSDLVVVVDLLDVAPRNDGIVPVADRPQNLLPVLLFRGLEKQLT